MYCELHLHSCFRSGRRLNAYGACLQARKLDTPPLPSPITTTSPAPWSSRARPGPGASADHRRRRSRSRTGTTDPAGGVARGCANLSRLLTRPTSPARGEPRVDFDWLPEHAEGLIALSGCRKARCLRWSRPATCAGPARPRTACAPSSVASFFLSCKTTFRTRTSRASRRWSSSRATQPRLRGYQQCPLHVRDRHRARRPHGRARR
jgi:hypothetical protein